MGNLPTGGGCERREAADNGEYQPVSPGIRPLPVVLRLSATAELQPGG